jgi:hypothetical protein
MTKWDRVLSNVGSVGVGAVQSFVEGSLNCEEVQMCFRNKYDEASAELRQLIRTRGTKTARALGKKALRRRGLV